MQEGNTWSTIATPVGPTETELCKLREYPRAFNEYKCAVCLLGLTIFAGMLLRGGYHPSDILELTVFFLLILFAELLPISLPGVFSEVVMTMPALVSLFLSHGASAMIVVSSIAIFAASMITHRRRYPIRRLTDIAGYNTAVHVITFSVASTAYSLAGGSTIPEIGSLSVNEILLPLFLWVVASTMANALLNATTMCLYSHEAWRVVVAQHLRWTIPNYLLSWPSGILFAYLYLKYGIYGILLVIVPFLVGRQALNQYARQRDAYLETITTLGSYMQHYHPYTRSHLERVADLANKIANQMGLPVQSLMFIREAGLLHDIGKVGVNEEILDKTGALTDGEWAIIKEHPARGAEILANLKYLECVVPWVRSHHERPDGKGYPDGLHDAQIPMEAAVIAVADAFDAMTGGLQQRRKRRYRPQLTVDQAIAQVRYGTGSQFNPRVVKAFLQVMLHEEEENGR